MRSNHYIRKSMSSLALVLFTTALATSALAAGHGGGGFGAGHGGMRMGGGGGVVGQRFFNDEIPMQNPVFNPSEPFTVHQLPEVPVSPAGPGSVLGNG